MAQYSRKELLEWINDFFQVNITSVQHLGTGAMYVQILDSLFPGQVDMDKVDWTAETSYDSLKNLKILQTSMARFNVQPPPTDFEALAKGNITENLEFLRFLKEHWDGHYLTENYDPVARREDCMMLKRKRSSERQGRRPSGGNLDRHGGSVGRKAAPSPVPRTHTTDRRSNGGNSSRGNGPINPTMLPPEILQGYREIFDELDMSGDGRVSWQELMMTLGLNQNRSQNLIHSGDANGDQMLNFPEFVQIMADPQTDLSINNNNNNNSSPPSSPSPAKAAASAAASPRYARTGSSSSRTSPAVTHNGSLGGNNAVAAAVSPSVTSRTNITATSGARHGAALPVSPATSARKSVGAPAVSAEVAQLKQQLEEEMRISKDLESERDFYYTKLCEVEMMCQDIQETSGDPSAIHSILEILWRPRE